VGSFLGTTSLFCPPAVCTWRTSSNRCRHRQLSLVVPRNAYLFPSSSPLFLRPLPTYLHVIHHQQAHQLILYLLYLLVLLVSQNMNSCLFYLQSVRGGPVIIHKRTAILSFLHAVLHPWVPPSPGQIPPLLPLRLFNTLECQRLYPISLIPIQKPLKLLLPFCHTVLRGVFFLPTNLMTASVLSTCVMSWAFMPMISTVLTNVLLPLAISHTSQQTCPLWI
jgi:hypothetical protein